ncbi:MAG TPA: FAD-dependent oxidoreductase [Chitinophagales bacterium]|nr:FAD-dependent oxidoreductase [Chitinophagales bacterium]
MYNYIIVGQGIAGTMLSWSLMQQGQRVLVVDKLNRSSATNVSAGITNPITGRRFVKTWLIDEIAPLIKETYTQFEKQFNDRFFYPVSILKIIESVKAQNDWSARCAMPEYLPYLKNESVIQLDAEKVKNDHGCFEISNGTRLDAAKFLAHYRNYLKEQDSLLDEDFDFEQLKHEADGVTYKNHSAQKIVFCDGANAINNPYFKFFPFQLAKGECLIVRIPDFYLEHVINGEVLVMPLQEKDLYYVGATHEWYFDDNLPSQKGKNEILGNLSTVLTAPFEIIEHKAAIRPTVKDRRPFLGFHPQYTNIGIFNGMGTKGISLAPYFAKHFTEHILQQKPLMKEVNINRFL